MPSRKPKPQKSWSMHPSLHDDVARLLATENLSFSFHTVDDDRDCTEDYDTNIMGRFICRNRACSSKGWGSKKIAITIRMYPGEKYNARVYHQRCKDCNWLSRPILDASYADRVAYRIKKWQGIQMETPYFSGESKGPHNRDLCEGCRHGHCEMRDMAWFSRMRI
ncbi:3CxxC-type zinc finger protein [Aspergillus clavatus NRRL 1]|uniref:3CxxC-type domain-containing protein n=1 Tax=Aspergillus clavatus (strain ATCC 1007 / CBS 513.65 / DSM 816 / NCTC 3887 / NRRL 1 / QM 1276 / 107) TaxID=344612 RepID=A1CMK2_ASPCL|nr:uncharacterized protein ACLA_097270 [Aspergillus clavatus NRRL 1]EAW08789.1 conserved hypothetical protein [Aspergillus clavatus NRRL 1]